MAIALPISSSKAGDHVSLTFNGDRATEGHDPAGAQELKLLARFVDRAAQKVTAMKLIIVAVATVFALSSAALAGDFSVDGVNGSTLGKSMRGVYNGVPYPNTNAANVTAPVGSWNAMPRGHHHWHYNHHKHHRHHQH